MKTHIRMKQRLMDELSVMLSPDERVIVTIPHGNQVLVQGRLQKADSRDYFLLTDKRLIMVKGRYFNDRIGFKAYSRKLCAAAETKHYNVGSNLSVLLQDPKSKREITLEINNCRKAEAEAIVKELTADKRRKQCPRCTGILEKEFTYCPNCGASLKNICPRCGKQLPDSNAACPHCGA